MYPKKCKQHLKRKNKLYFTVFQLGRIELGNLQRGETVVTTVRVEYSLLYLTLISGIQTKKAV